MFDFFKYLIKLNRFSVHWYWYFFLKKKSTHTNVKHVSIILTDDLSFQALASQSPVYSSPSLYDLYKASNAVDRNTATCMRTDVIGTNSVHKSTWWKVDLGGVYSIYSIQILFRDYRSFGMYVIVYRSSET